MIHPRLARLQSLLTALALDGLAPRAVSVGCGAYPSAWVLRETLPGWTLYGLDRDGAALRSARREAPFTRLIQADARSLPGLLHARFGLVLVRHPDLYRYHSAWTCIFDSLPAMLAPGGALLATFYAPEEAEVALALPVPTLAPLDEDLLAPPDLGGHDRFALAYRAPD